MQPAMHFLTALCLVLACLAIGEVVANLTRSKVPSVFVSAILFLLGFFTFFPSNIVELAGFGPVVVTMGMFLVITNMGTVLSLRELIAQWKTVVISITGVAGICIGVFTLGQAIFGYQYAVVAAAPMSGGVVASMLMTNAAKAINNDKLAVFATLIYIMHGFVGYPLTNWMLKKESRRLLDLFRSGRAHEESSAATTSGKPILPRLPQLPAYFQSNTFLLLKTAIIALCAYNLSVFIKPIVDIHPLVLCLVLGAISREINFAEENILTKANSFGFLILVIMVFIFSSLSKATPQLLLELMWPLIGIMGIAVIFMAIFAFVASKIFKWSFPMAFSVCLTALYGFPVDYVLTIEVIDFMSKTPEENAYLRDRLIPKMLVGGFATVTITSVILAGIFTKMLIESAAR